MSYNDAFFTELFRLLRYQALVEISAEREEHNRLRLELSLSSPKTTTRQSITTVPLLRSLLAPIFVFLGFSGKLQASMTLGVVSALLLCVPTQIGDRATFKPSMPNGISKARPSSNEALSYQDNSAAHWPELLITEPPFGSHLEATTVDLADPTSETPIFVELSTAISQSPDNADLNSTLDPGAWSTIGTLAFYSGAFGQNAGMLTFEAFDNTLNPGQTFAVSLFDDSRSLEAFDMNLLEQTELASVVSRDQLAWHSFAVSLELTGDVVSGLSSDDAGRFSSVIVGTNQSVGIVAEPSSSIGIALALIVIAIGRCWRIRKKGRYT